jgi:hypothetical protein
VSQSELVIALVLSLLAAAPVEGRFVLEVAGLPVAELRVSASGDRYLYESTHFLEEGPRERRLELSLSTLAAEPEVLALIHRPKPGCRDVLEERARLLEQLCVVTSTQGEVSGTIAGEAFVAHYDEAGVLGDITVGSARWLAAGKPVAPPPESPFVRGLAVPAGVLHLEPAVTGAKWLTRAPVGIGQAERVGRVRCLVLAREEAARRPKSRVAVGLVIEAGRAFPHAWLAEGENAFDPSVLAKDPLLAQRRYLEVPVEQSGAFYLRLFDGAVRLKAK